MIGAGFGGMYMLHKLRELGVSVQGFEAGDDVGGTWYWNRYPGARCDVPSLFYSYTWSEELQKEWRWTEKYAAQPEILAYANHVADRFDLRPLIAFETRVLTATFDEAADRWRLTTDRGDNISCRWLITATGCLSTRARRRFRASRVRGRDLSHRRLAARGRRFHRQAGGGMPGPEG